MNPDNDIPSTPLCRIVCAAIRNPDNGLVLAGARHYDTVMRNAIAMLSGVTKHDAWYRAEQGFITNIRGEFVTREQAWKIAEEAGQIRQQTGPHGTLFSEDLY